MSVKVYTARVERDGKYWLIHVPEVDRYTQARNLGEVEAMARSLVSSMLDVDAGSFDIREEIRLSGGIQFHLDASRHHRERAAEENAAAAREVRLAAAELAAEGLTVRDVGAVLGVSHQRVSQLLND